MATYTKSFHHCGKPSHGLDSLLPGVESGETDVTFAVGAETDSGSAGNIGLAQTLLEKFPGSLPPGRTHPDVW